MTEDKTKATEEQITYANVLNYGMWIGLVILVVTYIVYVSGMLPTFVSLEELPKYWGMNVKDYVNTLNAPTGWGWAAMLGKGDYLNFIGIAILAGLTIFCYLAVLLIFLKKRDIVYAIIVIVEIGVLVLAASGILTAGGH